MPWLWQWCSRRHQNRADIICEWIGLLKNITLLWIERMKKIAFETVPNFVSFKDKRIEASLFDNINFFSVQWHVNPADFSHKVCLKTEMFVVLRSCWTFMIYCDPLKENSYLFFQWCFCIFILSLYNVSHFLRLVDIQHHIFKYAAQYDLYVL